MEQTSVPNYPQSKKIPPRNKNDKKYLTKNETTTLLTSNFCLILYYNLEIWYIPTLAPELKQILMSASANALKLLQPVTNQMQSYINVHKYCNRAHPNQIIT